MARHGEDGDDAGTEAAYWLLVLEEEPDNAELRARFEAWLAADPDNRAAWVDTSEIHGLLSSPGYAEHRAARAATGMPSTASAGVGGRARRPWALPLAAMAVAAGLALIVLPSVLLDLRADYSTATAEVRSIILDDGSTVRLAPGSAVAVQQGNDRSVRLLAGEALFEVKPDKSRPFRVLAAATQTTVLGTEFTVRLVDDGAMVAVREGEVRVDVPAPPVAERLKAGDWVQIDGAGAVRGGTVAPAEVASWLNGRIVARDRSIEDIVDEVRRSYGGLIVMASPSLGRERVTGVYNLSDPAYALRAAVGVHGGTVRQLSPWLLVISGI